MFTRWYYVFLSLVLLSACTPPILAPTIEQVLVSASVATTGSGTSVKLKGDVTGSGNFDPTLTWTASGGSLSSTSGATVTLTAPTVNATTQITVTATSVADATKTGKFLISVTPTVTKIETITINSPSLMLATGGTLQLSATARDASGQALSNTAFTWISLDPSIIEISSSGVATAKRFGAANIQATSEGKSSVLRLSTFGIEGAGGVAAFDVSGKTLKGTSLFFNLRTLTGSSPTAPLDVRVDGPTGWNNGQSLALKVDFALPWAWVLERQIAPVSGSYSVSALVSGNTTRFSFVVDATVAILPLKNPLLQNTFWSRGTNPAVYLDFKWANETASKSFRVHVLDESTGIQTYTRTLSTPQQGLMSDYTNAILDETHTYKFEVVGLNSTISDTAPITPLNFHVSAASRTILQFPASDMTYGTQGEATLAFKPTVILALSSGKILAGGSADNGILNSPDFVLARLNNDGSIDKTFGTNGYVYTNFYARDTLTKIAISTSGKILALGESEFGMQSVVARYSAEGVLDASFGTSGRLVIAAPYSDKSLFSALAITSDGFVVGGSYKPSGTFYVQPIIVKYLENGTLDPAFGTAGETYLAASTTDTSGGINNIEIMPDGKLLSTGYFTPYMYNGGAQSSFVTRLETNGSLDVSFGQLGTKIFNLSSTFEELRLIQQLPDGKLLAAGYLTISDNSLSDYLVVRLLANGELDPTFGTNGYTVVDSGGQYDTTAAMILINGQIWLFGQTGIDVISLSGENLGTISVSRNSTQIGIQTALLTQTGRVLIPLAPVVAPFDQGVVGSFRPL
jgi:uncharacterized delta-60 repeat protein